MTYEKQSAYLSNKYPAISDLRKKAKRRIPHVAWEYLETGTGDEYLIERNIRAMKAVTFLPRFLKGELKPEISTTLFGKKYNAPFGIAPVGLTGLMWPKAEILLAKTAKKYNLPFCLSTVATETPEAVGAHMGNQGWFQLYPPREIELTTQFLNRAKQAGFHTLIITGDVPTPSRRERTKRAGLQMPPKITPRLIWQGIKNPAWSMATLKRGLPSLRTIESYSEFKTMMSVGAFTRDKLGGNLSWEYCEKVREIWKGPIIIKGILHPKDAEKAIEIGMDGIVVSNHGGRQFDGAPSSIEALPAIAQTSKGKIKILFDSGIRTGLDIMRALALGADFVLCGRAFIYGVAALGEYGGYHAAQILMDDLKNNMVQIGVEQLEDIGGALISH